jgi:hypothetical protein
MSYIAKTTDVAARMVGGEMMIMSARDSTLFSLNDVASTIWNAADGVTPLAEIVEKVVCAEYDVDLERALPEAQTLVEDLASHGVLIVSDRPIVSANSAERAS